MSEGAGKDVSLINLGSLTKPLDTATKGIFDGAGAFLSKICLPAAEELGLLVRDRVSYWRALNLAKVLKKTEGKLRSEYKEVSPKIILPIIEGASLEDDAELQDVWANLLASSIDPDFEGHAHPAFPDIVRQLEAVDVHILRTIFLCTSGSVGGAYVPLYFVEKSTIQESLNISDEVYERSIDNLVRVRCVTSYVE